MKQSVPWSVKGVEADARESAKDLARRSGMTLGQWLNTMIARQAGDMDAFAEASPAVDTAPVTVPTSPLADLEARIERLDRLAADTAAAPSRGAGADWPADLVRESEARTAGILETLLRRSSEVEGRTAQLIESLARANRETESKTANALAAVAKWIEQAERAPRVEAGKAVDRQTQEAVRGIAARLDQIEAKLPRDEATKPLKTAIEGLEARLTALMEQGRATHAGSDDVNRTAADLEERLAEMAAKIETADKARKMADGRVRQVEAIEAKIGGLLDSITARSAEAKVRAPRRPANGEATLAAAVDQINRRQKLLDEPSAHFAVPQWPPRPLEEAPAASSAPALASIETQIATLTDEIRALRRAGQESRTDLSSDPTVTQLKSDVATIARTMASLSATREDKVVVDRLDALAQRIEALREQGASASAIRTVETHLAEIAKSLPEKASRGYSDLSAEIRSLAAKLDQIAVQQAELVKAPRIADESKLAPAIADLRADIAAMSDVLSSVPADASTLIDTKLDAIIDRIGALREQGAPDPALGQIERNLVDIMAAIDDLAPREADQTATDLRDLLGRIDGLAAQTVDPAAITRLQRQAEDIHALITESVRPEAFVALADRIDVLDARLEQLQAMATPSLEPMIEQLVARLETAQRSDADDRTLDALERQIGRIAERLDEIGPSQPDLSGIERTLGELFGQLETTRDAARQAADDAAISAVREAMAQFNAAGSADMRRHLVDMRSSQDEVERKTQLTLDAVHATLERLADRMMQFEADLDASRVEADNFGALSSARAFGQASPPAPREPEVDPAPAPMPAVEPAKPAPAAAAARAAEPMRQSEPVYSASLGPSPAMQTLITAAEAVSVPAPMAAKAAQTMNDPDLGADVPLEPGGGGAPLRATRPAAELSPAKAMAAAAAGSDPRASFIAAARRAAQAAAGEAAPAAHERAVDLGRVDAKSRPASVEADAFDDAEEEEEARPSPIERVRNLYARRKRPILLGLAAVVLALGTIQVAKLASPDRALVNGDTTGELPVPPAEAAPDASEPVPAPGPQSAVPQLEPPQASAAPETKPAEVATLPPAAAPEAAAPDNVGSLGTNFSTLEEGVAAGDARALYEKASAEVDARNPQRDLAKATELYILSAQKGFAPAQYRLGSMFEKGLGIEKDVEQARQWYEKAAARGNLKAMHNMAVLYAEGAFGGQADYTKAAEWFRSAAEHGLRDSEYNYAVLVARGLGTTTDLPQAYKWFSLAAAQGDEDAAAKRDEVAKRLDQATLDRLKTEIASFVPAQAPAAANETTLPTVSWATQAPGGV